MSNVHAGEEKQYVNSYGWAAKEPSGILSLFHFSRRANGDKDITMKILYCGICHADVHFLKNDHGISLFPMVPGHEIVGEVVNVGQGVTKFRVGDIAGVGPMVGSCGSCANCTKGLEAYCPKGILTYSARYHDGSITQGGYSNNLVVEERFAITMPKNIQLDRAAPLLCAGITVYSPMKYYGLDEPGLHVGVAGLGGLGHVAVKFAKAFGMKVTVISTSPGKREEALERLGADAFLISQDQQQLQDAIGTMDGIIDTVSGNHSIQPLIGLLKTSGKLIMVGAPPLPLEVSAMSLLLGRKIIGGSAAGGTEEMQEMIDFAAKHNVAADVEVIPMDYVNTALERLGNNDVRYRFVIDVANTLNVPAPTN